MKVMGKFRYGWDGFASVSGHISLGMLGNKFNAEGGVQGVPGVRRLLPRRATP